MIFKDAGGREIKEWPGLAGSKWAVRRGHKLFVSPAMMVLIRDCESQDDLYDLLARIPFRVLSMSRPLPGQD